jgi:hypothetical protein
MISNLDEHKKDFSEKMEEAGLVKPIVDVALYAKLMRIDPSAARNFIQTRLDNIKAQIEPLKEELKQLNDIMSYDKNKEISSYYEKTHKINKVYGITAWVNAFLLENIGKEFRAGHIYQYLKSMGHKIDSVNQVSVTLHRLFIQGQIKKPYRAVYKMEKRND